MSFQFWRATSGVQAPRRRQLQELRARLSERAFQRLAWLSVLLVCAGLAGVAATAVARGAAIALLVIILLSLGSSWRAS